MPIGLSQTLVIEVYLNYGTKTLGLAIGYRNCYSHEKLIDETYYRHIPAIHISIHPQYLITFLDWKAKHLVGREVNLR
jgi:hypothetical protein